MYKHFIEPNITVLSFVAVEHHRHRQYSCVTGTVLLPDDKRQSASCSWKESGNLVGALSFHQPISLIFCKHHLNLPLAADNLGSAIRLNYSGCPFNFGTIFLKAFTPFCNSDIEQRAHFCMYLPLGSCAFLFCCRKEQLIPTLDSGHFLKIVCRFEPLILQNLHSIVGDRFGIEEMLRPTGVMRPPQVP